jgi:hypothetical protein
MGAAAIALATAVAWACTPSAFRCENHEHCEGLQGGACEPSGFCSIPDDACASGRAYAPHAGALSGQCVAEADQADSGTSSTSDDSTLGTTEAQTDGSDGSTSDPWLPDVGTPVDTCTNGVQDPDETDVDCGGACGPCPMCSACIEDTDCAEGVCDVGICTTVHPFEVDWLVHCGVDDSNDAQIDLPPGRWRARALPSAGSKWGSDGANGGLSWGWRMDCDGFDFGDLRTPPRATWHATPEAAFESLVAHEIERDHEGGIVSCRMIDTQCTDNRGGTLLDFVLSCDP